MILLSGWLCHIKSAAEASMLLLLVYPDSHPFACSLQEITSSFALKAVQNMALARPDIFCSLWLVLCAVMPRAGVVQMIAHASRLKEQANALYRNQKVEFAIKKYDRAVSNLKRFHGEYTDKQGMIMTALHAALLSNLAAAYMAKGVRTM
jgi:hypothetical protein